MKAERGSKFVNRLYRLPAQGKVFGVCAGLADYFGFDVTVTRVLVAMGAIFSAPLVIVAYIVLGFLLPVRSYEDGERDGVDPVQRQLRANPHSSALSVQGPRRPAPAAREVRDVESLQTGSRVSGTEVIRTTAQRGVDGEVGADESV
jgi:phage shock protein C